MFYVTLNKRNPVISQHTPLQHARAHYCSTERHTRSFSLALVAADTQGHAASCTNQVLASTQHQPFGFVSTPSFFAVHYLDCSRSPTMVTILLVVKTHLVGFTRFNLVRKDDDDGRARPSALKSRVKPTNVCSNSFSAVRDLQTIRFGACEVYAGDFSSLE